MVLSGGGSVFRDADRLAASVRGLTDRFGPEVLSDPMRVRNLLLDDYGVDARSERSDVDAFVSVLAVGVSAEEPLDDATARVVEATSLAEEDARWSLVTARSTLRPVAADGADLTVGPGPTPPPPPPYLGLDGPGPTVVAGGPDVMESDLVGPRGWPGAAKVAVAALLLVAVAGGALVVMSRSDLSDARAEIRAAEEQLEKLGQESGSDIKSLGELIDGLRAERDGLAAEVSAAESEKEELLADNRSALEDLAELKREFSVSTLNILPSRFVFEGSVDRTACEGLTNCGEADSDFLTATFTGGQAALVVDINGAGPIPLSTMDGLSYSGSAIIDWGYTCSTGAVAPVTMGILAFPVGFRIEPDTRVVTADTYNVRVTFSAPRAACSALSETYLGTLAT